MGKQGLCVDLKDPRGLQLTARLVDTADVFIENYRPGALAKLGLGYPELVEVESETGLLLGIGLRPHRPGLRRAPGFGLIAEAKSGAMAQLGTPGEAPPLMRMPLADMYTGIHGVAAVCAALVGRATTGKGQHIDLALYDCMVSMHDYAVQRYTLSGGKDIAVQTGSNQPDSTVYGAFTAKDGYLVIAAQVDDAWKRLAQLIGGDALAADKRFLDPASRNAHNKEAIALVQAWTAAQPSRAACIAALDAVGIPCAPVQRIDEVLADPQTLARGMVIEQDHPVLGRVKLPNLPFHFSDCDTSPRCPAPLMGQHNRDIAESLGYPPRDVDAMVRDGVLYAEEAVALLATRKAGRT